MKKFLTAIVFLIFTVAGFSQCINVQTTSIKGNCYNDNQIKVTAQEVSPRPAICLPSNGKFIVEIQGDGQGGDMFRMKRSSPSAPAEYTFYNLKAGKYRIIVRDEDTGAFEEREVDAESNYKIMNVQGLQALAPTCGIQYSGGVRFQIPNGGEGPFDITILDATGNNVLVPTQRFTRPSGSNYIEVRGTSSHPILKNTVIMLQIKDVTSIGDKCGETRRYPSIQIPVDQYSLECINIRMHDRYMVMHKDNCGKYNGRFRIVRTPDGNWIHSGISDATAIKTYFSKPGTAVVRFLNSSKPQIDISNTFDLYGFYIKDYIFEKGDEIEVTIKGPNNTIVEKVRFNEQIDPITCPKDKILTVRNYSHNRNCGLDRRLYLYYYFLNSQYRNMPNIDGGTYSYLLGWTHTQDISYFTLEKATSASGPWTVVPMVRTVPGAGQAQWNGSGYIYLDNVGEGFYRLTYKNSNNCYGECSDIQEIKYPVSTTTNIDKIWDNIETGYGVYEGTGSFKVNYSVGNFAYPLKFKLEAADGVTTRSYEGKISFFDRGTRTITFPLEVTTSGSGYGYTNLPEGNYKVTATDACGITTDKIIYVPGMPAYKPELKYEKDCEIGKIIYNIGNQIYKDPYIFVYLEQEIEDAYGHKTWREVKQPSGLTYVRNHTGEFVNLLTGKYRIRTTAFYYNSFLRQKSGTIYQTSLTDPGIPGSSTFYKEISIPDLVKLNPVVNPVICHQGSATGMIAVDVTGQEVYFPLTFRLYQKTSATATTATLKETVKLEASDNKYFNIFENLTTGYYLIETEHRCQTVPKDVDIDLTNAFNPFLVIDRPVPFCTGNQARVKLGLSEHLFDINWFKLDANGDKTTTYPLRTGESFWEAIYTTTTYMAEYKLKPGIGCTNSTIYTKTVTVVLPPIDEPPLVKNCPSNIEVTVDPGQCGKAVQWREPEAYPTCSGGITTTRSHAPGDIFPIGVHTVTYTFKDNLLATISTCTFVVTVKSNALKLKTSQRYVDTSGNPITHLSPNQAFFYELSYENVGAENIRRATITVKLPSNITVVTNGEPDLNNAGDGTATNPQPQKSYNPTTKTYQFLIGSASGYPQSTLKLGDPNRTIRIPMKVVADCDKLLEPCTNYLQTVFSISYEGGPNACPIAQQLEEGTKSITVDTSNCARQEVLCGSGVMTLEATGSFDGYQWFKNGSPLTGETNRTYQANGPGVYKVVKTLSCQGYQVETTETIQYQAVAVTTDPIRAQAQNIGVTCADNGSWTSHFYLCQGGSKNITVSYKNTAFEWQQWNGSCTDPSSDCRNMQDQCWTTFHTNSTFVANTAGKYRLKLLNCNESFYFEVFTAGFTGALTDIIDETDFSQGSVKLNLSTSGVTYKLEIYKAGALFRTEVITTNDYHIQNLPKGTYDVKVTSPQIPGCEYNGQATINKTSQMEMTAVFKGWTKCNTAKFELKAKGGVPTYRFYIWTIDGEKQYADEPAALNATDYKAIQLAHQASVEVEIPSITRVGEYVFLVGDMRSGAFALSNKVTVSPPEHHSFTFSATQEIQCESNPNTGVINLTFAPGSQNQNRKINLYKLDETGARVGTAFQTSTGGLFTSIPAGTYEIEMISQVGGTTCVYIKKPIVILPPQTPLRAYAGVMADRSCDTTNNQYKVSVNNVTGGTPPYKYSFDGENTYVMNPIGFIGGSTTIYVKDSKDCRIEIPITTQATSVPSITLSPVLYRCDNGYGSVTITVSSTVSQTYQYTLDGSAKQNLTSNSFNRLLSPGVHTLTVYYRPTDTSTTPNVLFTEDFGKNANDCLPAANTSLVCNTTGSLSDGNQVLTKQLQITSNPNWITTAPADPSGGRYLAVSGNGNNEVVYQKILKGVALNTEFTVSIDALNLIRTGVTAVPAHLNIEIAKTDGTTLRSKSLATINSNSWTNYKVTFTEAEMTGFANGELLVKVVNTAAATYGALGNDFVMDNLNISQAITYCDLKVIQLINIETNKQMRAEKYGIEKNVSCIGELDGQVSIKVINPSSTNIEYSVQWTHTATTTWTPIILNAQGVFTVTGLEATQNGVVSIRDAANPNCAVSVGYKIGEPTPIVPTIVLMDKVTCYNGGVAKIKVSATGGNAGGYQYKVGLVSGTLGTLQPVTAQVNPYEIVNLSPGTYTLVVQDTKGCTTETTFVIDNKATLSATAEPTSYCYGDMQEKKVRITVISGNGNYRVQRVGGSLYAFNSLNFEYPDALNAGTHTFVVTDGFGCQTTITTQIYEPLALTISPTQLQYADCKGSSVTYTLTASGGIPTALKEFKYSTDGGVTFQTIGLSASQVTFVYPVTVATTTEFRFQVTYKPDGSECKREQYITLAYDPPRFLTNTFTTTQATCGNNNGSVIITPSDYYVGTASHTLKVINGLGAIQNSTALSPGNYIAHLTDDRGCVATQAFTITAVPQLTATATVSKQMGCTSSASDLAAITVTLNGGGMQPFVINVRNTTSGREDTQTLTTSNNISRVFSGLDYGNYNITITDGNSCVTHLTAVILPNSNVMSIKTITPTTCATTAEVHITATSSPTFTASTNAYFAVYRPGIQNPPAGSVLNTVTTLNADGINNDIWYRGVASGTGVGVTIGGLTPGVQYTFVAYNMTTQCRFTQQMSTPIPTASSMSVVIDVKNVSCASNSDGTFTYTLTNPNASTTHIDYQVYREDNHQLMAGAVGSVPAPFTTARVANGNLPAGKYYVKFTETIGGVASCVISKSFEIKRSLVQLQISATATKKASCNTLGEAWLNIAGGTATYTYGYVASGTVYSPAVMTRTVQTSAYINLPAGNWDLYVYDAYGCLQSTTLTIAAFDAPHIDNVATLACQAYYNTNAKIPVRVTLDKIGQGNHYYSLDGAADRPVVWTIANQAFELEVTPLTTHTVIVKDVNGCVTTATFSTTALITATATISRIKTCATPTADITITVAGGTGIYSYTLERLDNGLVAGTILSQDVAFPTPTGGVITIPAPAEAATYRISIYDAETVDCHIVKEVIVRDPDPINTDNIVLQPYHEKCNLGLTATGTGSIDIVMPTDSDSYIFRITRAIDITTGNNVTVTTTPASSGSHTATFTQLHGTPQGVKYQIIITNSTGCVAYVETIITSPEPLELQSGVITATQYVCNGNNGLSTPKVTIDTMKIRGGIPPYTIEFFDNGGNSLGNGTEYALPNLNGGIFYATVKDTSGACATSTTSVTIVPAFELQTLSITTTTSATCVVDEVINISLTVTPTYIAGTPLRYEIKGTDNAFTTITTTTATNLSLTLTGSQNLSGSNYTVEVFNENTGCSIKGVHTVKDANTFEMTSYNPVRAVCHNDNGSIAITLVDKDLSNGDQSTAGFTYTVTAVSGGTTTTGTVLGNTTTLTLVGGSYDIEAISNATGCKVSRHRFVIPSNPAEIKVVNVYQKVSVDCANENGVIALTIIGGQQTYTVTLTPLAGGTPKVQPNVLEGSPGIEIAGLDAGTYNITVVDALGCTTATGTLSVTVAPYNAINTSSVTVATTSITCVDSKDGTLKVSGVTGGTRPYHFMLFNGSTKVDEISGVNGDEATFSNIEPGTYHIDILDAQNCSVTLAGSYTFVNPTAITADVNTINSKFVTCKGTRDGKVEIVNITGGTGSYTVSILRSDTKQSVKTHNNITSTTDFFDELGVLEGTYYEIEIKDSNNCTMTKTLSFTVEELADVSINELKYYGTCQASTNSYVDYLEVHFNSTSPDYSKITYNLNGVSMGNFTRTTGNVAYIDNFNRGSVTQTVEVIYTIVSSIPGMTGSCSASETITIDTYTPLTVTQVTTNTTLNTLEVLAQGGRTTNFRGYTYYFNEVSKGDNPVYKVTHNDPDKIVGGRRYKVVNVRVEDAEGCTVTATFDIEYFDIEVPNFFTPNGDGDNEVWRPKYLDNNVNARIYIFDRYGRRLVVLESGQGWDGTYEKRPMPSGDYWYIIEINDQLYDKREFYGNFTLFR